MRVQVQGSWVVPHESAIALMSQRPITAVQVHSALSRLHAGLPNNTFRGMLASAFISASKFVTRVRNSGGIVAPDGRSIPFAARGLHQSQGRVDIENLKGHNLQY